MVARVPDAPGSFSPACRNPLDFNAIAEVAYIYGLSTKPVYYHSISYMRALLLAFLLLAVLASVPGDGIEGCDGHESRFQLGEQEPLLAATVANGKKFTYGTTLPTQTTTAASSTCSPSRALPSRWVRPTARS